MKFIFLIFYSVGVIVTLRAETPKEMFDKEVLASKSDAYEKFTELKDPNSKLSRLVKSMIKPWKKKSPNYFNDSDWPFKLTRTCYDYLISENIEDAKQEYISQQNEIFQARKEIGEIQALLPLVKSRTARRNLEKLLQVNQAIVGDSGAFDEITIYDSNGLATAYYTKDLVIYLWDGEPTAYLQEGRSRKAINIFGFNGQHLGWVGENDSIYDHTGYPLGGTARTFATTAELVDLRKSSKKVKPMKNTKGKVPNLPPFKDAWSSRSLKSLLLRGAK